MPPTPSNTPIRILHLSDFHFSGKKAWDADPVMNAMARNIGDEVAGGRKPDLVAITGDLAFSGKADEYAAAQDWLKKTLWPALGGLKKDRLLLVPGNHDVYRPAALKRSVKGLHKDLLEEGDQQAIKEVLADADERAILLRRHDAYLDFCKASATN
jgi:3',5'-cyclic AMP phosphodiesterase CpdA